MVIPADQQLRDGIAIVDKTAGWTSHDVVAKARGILQNKKIGHSGTLDPDATGVLVLGVGRVTRLLRFVTGLPKSYVGEIVLGIETTTLDAAGDVTATHEMSGVTLDEVRTAASGLTGDILQVPPMVSAVKIDGKRLYELAREGKEVERAARPVTVFRFEVTALASEPGVYRAEVDCSSGTYVRTLAADLGRALGGGAHLRALRRTAIGSFTLDQARPLEEVTVLPAREAVRDLPAITVDAEIAHAICHGKVLPYSTLGIPVDAPGTFDDTGSAENHGLMGLRNEHHQQIGPWAMIDEQGVLLAVYETHRGMTVKPAVVVVPAAT